MKAMHRVGLVVLATAYAVGPALASDGGDPRRINFTLPLKKAMAKAKAENRMLFLKPIYGGVDEIGARDYRAGNW